MSNDMLAIAVISSPKHAMSRGYSSCRTVQVLPECLRLSKVPAVHCNIAIALSQPGNPEKKIRPTPSWLPPGRYTRSIVAKDEL